MRTLFRELVVMRHRAEDDHDKRMTLAWTTVALKRTRKLPTLKSLLTPEHVRQTVQEKRIMLETLSEMTGIPLRKRKKKKAKVTRG
jgi:hypothetical protein